MRHAFALLSAFLLFVPASPPLSAAGPRWPHEESDLPPDPAVTWGHLPNGLRYAILKHQEPGEAGRPNRTVSMRLCVRAGSLMEEEDQQGLAHFLEHMAFNGTRHFPAGEMVKYFQRLGMAFGAHTNAETSFNKTYYQLELPENTEAYLDDALKLFRDYADGILLEQKEIDRERGVILSEKLDRDSADYRTLVESFKFLMPESLLSRRLPIGAEDVIRTAPRERLLSFYRKWYTPDRMTLIVVGPVSPSDLAAKIESHFGSMKPPAQPVADPDLGKIVVGRGLRTRLHSEPATRQTAISIEVLRPWRRGPDTREAEYGEFLRDLADRMLNRRLDKLTKGEDPPFLSASSHNEESIRYLEENSLGIACKPEGWERALATGEQELRRALKFGFTPAEFQEAASTTLALFENAARQAGTRHSRDLADRLLRALMDNGRVFTHPDEDLADVTAWLQKATPEQCAEALRKAWDSEDITVFVYGNLALADGAQKIKDALLKSRQVAVRPPAEEKRQAWAYTDFGPTGTVAQREEVKDLGLTLVAFANHVRLNLKPTQFEKGTIRISVDFGAGRLTAPKDKPGLVDFAEDMFIGGGLEKHGVDDVNALSAGKTAKVRFAVGDEFFTLAGTTNRKDLAFQLQLLCAYLTAPGYREDRSRVFGQEVDSLYNAVEHDLDLAAQYKLPGYLYNGDVRLSKPEKEDLKARTMAELRQWLAEPLRSSWLEIGVVGDFDPKDVIEGVAATFGALPARAAARPEYIAERLVPLVAPGTEKVIRFNSKIPKAAVILLWPTAERFQDVKRARQCDVLAAVLGDRVREKVRQELGETYSPDVISDMSETFTHKGAVLCGFTCEAKDAPKLGRIVTDLASKLATEGATPDELDRAKKPILKQVEENRRHNTWWMRELVAQAQSNPKRLDWARTYVQDYEGTSRDDVNRLAKTSLGREQAIVVLLAPEEGAPRTALKKSEGAR